MRDARYSALADRYWVKGRMLDEQCATTSCSASMRCGRCRRVAHTAAEHDYEQSGSRLLQPLDMAHQFVDPVRHLVAERRRHDVLAVRATRHGIGALCSAISAIAVSVSPISRKNCTMHPARHAARRPREEAPIRAAQECGRRGQDLRRCARPNSMRRAAHTTTSAASAGMIPSPACALARATSTSSQAC